MSPRFRKAWTRPLLSPDEGRRQGRVVKSALAVLGGADARDFLNAHHDGLRGRPLDLALASDAGLAAVEAALGAAPQAAEASPNDR